jgi:hypothetical protein
MGLQPRQRQTGHRRARRRSRRNAGVVQVEHDAPLLSLAAARLRGPISTLPAVLGAATGGVLAYWLASGRGLDVRPEERALVRGLLRRSE